MDYDFIFVLLTAAFIILIVAALICRVHLLIVIHTHYPQIAKFRDLESWRARQFGPYFIIRDYIEKHDDLADADIARVLRLSKRILYITRFGIFCWCAGMLVLFGFTDNP